MADKGISVETDIDEYKAMSVNADIGRPDEKGIIEAEIALQARAKGMYREMKRPPADDPVERKADVDFKAVWQKNNGELMQVRVDVKKMVDYETLSEQKGIDTSGFSSHEDQAYKLGKSIGKQNDKK
uniref:Uncharacterized protein n=1 Tax=Amicula sp. isolate GU52X-4 cfCalB7 TaxID=3003489 RepID=A0A9E9C136_9STRA|nr:hypothetical protein [Amicula sp. isolate GU52X-4 cfCalB7]WAK84974.1 hypothetical protein [Amicula sp. isolate GU52X-4 cfCalB7]